MADAKNLVVTRATLNTETPIAGVEIVPYIVTRKSDGTSTTDDIPREAPIDGQYLRYRWYRSGRKSRTAVCSVHPAEVATLQNVHNRQKTNILRVVCCRKGHLNICSCHC